MSCNQYWLDCPKCGKKDNVHSGFKCECGGDPWGLDEAKKNKIKEIDCKIKEHKEIIGKLEIRKRDIMKMDSKFPDTSKILIDLSKTISPETIGKYYILPKNTVFWSIELQESIDCTRDLIVKITNVCIGNTSIFAMIQDSFLNMAISMITGKDETTYMDKKNGEIALPFDKLISKK